VVFDARHEESLIMELIIRQATLQDAQIITQFNALMGEETEGKKLDKRTLTKGVQAVLTDEAKGLYYVAEVDGGVVGQLMITYEWSDWRNANFWWIQSVYVEKEYRGRGVFTSLFRHVREIAEKRSDVCGIRLYVEKSNARAQSVYEQLGMHRSHYEMFELEFNKLETLNSQLGT
jgi:GNAT superfamily N-acetyltransferase